RQISVQAPPLGLLTMVVGKDVNLASGETVTVAPVRYLVYPGRAGQQGEIVNASSADAPPPEEVRLEAAAPPGEPVRRPSGRPGRRLDAPRGHGVHGGRAGYGHPAMCPGWAPCRAHRGACRAHLCRLPTTELQRACTGGARPA